jgi:hypothetical protein
MQITYKNVLLAKLPIAKNYPERENASFFVINNYKLGPILAIFWEKTKDIVIVKRLPVICVSKTYCLYNWILELFRNYDFFREQNGLIGIGSVVLP